jgi:hypothetical protein
MMRFWRDPLAALIGLLVALPNAALCLAFLFGAAQCPCLLQTQPYPSDSGVANILNYGAVSDPTCATDNLAAFQGALAAVPPAYPNAASPYQTAIVYVPSGTYCVSGQIRRTVTNATFTGVMSGGTTLTASVVTGTISPGTPIFDTTGQIPVGGYIVSNGTGTGGAGTYTVNFSATFSETVTAETYQTNLALIGQDKSNTTIRLQNGSAGFGSSANPRALIYTASNPSFNTNTGSGNFAFGNAVENLTIDVNTGNAGAQAFDFLASNTGGLRQLNILGHGNHVSGVSMMRAYPGPFIIEDVSIDAFDTCVEVGWPFALVTMETVSLTHCSVRCIQTTSQIIAANNLTCQTNDPAAIGIQNANQDCFAIVTCNGSQSTNMGLLVLANTAITAPSGGSAPLNQTSDQFGAAASSWNFGLNVSASGFTSGNGNLSSNAGHGATTGLPATQWTLTGTRAPSEVVSAPWINAFYYGNNYDFVAALKKAFALAPSGSVVYLPTGSYTIADPSQLPIVIPNTVQSVKGMFSVITFVNSTTQQPYCLFSTDPSRPSNSPIFLERFYGNNLASSTPVCLYDHTSAATAALRDISGVPAFIRESGGGPLYAENMNTTHVTVLGSQPVFMRQMDPEASGTCYTINGTASVWVLGLKSEEGCTLLDISGGATVEVLGSSAFCGVPTCLTDVPARSVFNVDNGNGSGTSKLSVAFAELVQNNTGWAYPVFVNWKNATVPNPAWPYRGAYNGVMAANWSSINNTGGTGSFTNNTPPSIAGPTNCYTDTSTSGGSAQYCPTLTTNPGVWTLGSQPPPVANEGYSISYTYNWYYGSACTGSVLATTATYTLSSADITHTLVVGVTAHSGATASSQVCSSATATITNVNVNPDTGQGIIVHYDASLSSKVTCTPNCGTTGNAITQLTDRVSGTNNATQSTNSQRPTIVVPAQNGLNAALFSSANNQLMSLGSSLAMDGLLTISSGAYNNGSGVITLTMSTSVNVVSGDSFTIPAAGLTGTGGFASLAGTWLATTSSTGTTVTLQGNAGAGTSAITGGNLTSPGYTIVAVVRRGGASSGAGVIELFSNASQLGSSLQTFGGLWHSNTNMYTGVTYGYQRGQGATGDTTNFHVLSWYISGNEAGAEYTIDGSQIPLLVSAPTTLDAATFDTLGVPVDTINVSSINGMVGEVSIYRGHFTGSPLANVTSLNIAKWGVH